jgi:uncharacterized Zn-binding protein involved in type VI secretion
LSDEKTARVGDRTDHGGTVLTGDPKRIVQGQKIARIGDRVSCPRHGLTTIISTTAVKDNSSGKQVARVTSRCACGAVIITGSDKGRVVK